MLKPTTKASRLMTIIRVSTTQRILFSPISSCSIQILSTIPFQRNSTKVLVNSGSPSESKNIGNAIAKIAPNTIANVKDNAKLKIVDKATTPKAPTSPNVSRNVMIAFAAGIIISLIISFVRDILDVKIKYNDEMTTVLDLPLLAAIPDFEYFSNQKAAEKKYGDYESGY